MDQENPISFGVIPKIIEHNYRGQVVLQILADRNHSSIEHGFRYRALLSDGQNKYQNFLFVNLQLDQIQQGLLEKYSLIQLIRYELVYLESKHCIVIFEAKLAAKGTVINGMIGNPSKYTPLNVSVNNLSLIDWRNNGFEIVNDDSAFHLLEFAYVFFHHKAQRFTCAHSIRKIIFHIILTNKLLK